jgi:hypothetical protein
MAKRQKPAPMEVELKKRLDEQDHTMEVLNKTMNQVLDLLKGSEMMSTPGLIKTFKDFEVRMADFKEKMDYFERWWDLQKMKKGTFTFKTANLLTRGLSIIGGAGALAAMVYTIIKIFQEVKQ